MKKIFAVSAALLMMFNTAQARKASGTVSSGETVLPGVIVTDGKNFTQTNKNGKFSFEIEDEAEYVYIVTPSGYMADWTSGTPAFYQEAKGNDKFIFNLQKASPDICWGNPELDANYRREHSGADLPFYPVAGRYAFYIGHDLVVFVDNIAGSLAWVKGLEALLPDNMSIYVAQSSPLEYTANGRRVIGTLDVLDILDDHKVTFLSGHCADYAPQGYKMFTTGNGRLEWYHKAVGHPKDYQASVEGIGRNPKRPNSVTVDVWDYDPSWKVEWFEDGESMGTVKPEQGHLFSVTPSQYAKNVTVAVENRFGQSWVYDVDVTDYIDVQAHRGGAGLMPENTVVAMKNALDMGVNTLEIDLQISADGQVVVCHDPYFHHRYSIRPDGSPVLEGDKKEYLYNMPYSEVVKYDVGSRKSEVWPDKACIKASVPLAEELITFVENYTKEMGYSPVRYNIEIKSRDADGEGKNWPTYDAFATMCCRFLHSMQLGDRLLVQSFDTRVLNYIHEKYPEMAISYLVDDDAADFDTYMAKLKFTPQWLSAHHSLVDEALVQKCREKGMKLACWTVDKPEDIARMIKVGVDSIISNYPDRVLEQTR